MVVASTVERVKRLIPIEASNVSQDPLITDLLAAVSREVEHHVGYEFELKSRVETFNVDRGARTITLAVVPVVSVSEVKVSADQDFSGDALVAIEDYRLVKLPGVLWFASGVLPEGVGVVRVTYTAGLGATTNDVIAAAPDLAYAVDMQAAEEFRRATSPSTQVRPGPRGNRSFSGALGLLDRVRDLVAPYRRVFFPESIPEGS